MKTRNHTPEIKECAVRMLIETGAGSLAQLSDAIRSTTRCHELHHNVVQQPTNAFIP